MICKCMYFFGSVVKMNILRCSAITLYLSPEVRSHRRNLKVYGLYEKDFKYNMTPQTN